MKRAFVLAGGLGTRLAPYTTVLPKPLMPVGHTTILERLITGLVSSGLSDITICLGYLGHLVEAVVGDGSRSGASVTYTREETPLGTAGALRLMPDVQDDDTILVVNGDAYSDLDFSEPVENLAIRGADALIVCVVREVRIDYGVLDIDETGWLRAYTEKPTSTYLVSTGINVLRGAVLRSMPPGRLDMPELLWHLSESGGKGACLQTNALWRDLGRPDDLILANEDARGS